MEKMRRKMGSNLAEDAAENPYQAWGVGGCMYVCVWCNINFYSVNQKIKIKYPSECIGTFA